MGQDTKRMAWIGLIGLASGGAVAHESITTDRPGLVESSTVVGEGHTQVEASVALNRETEGSPRNRTYSTPTLIRYGISDRLELRLEADGLMQSTQWDGGVKSIDRGTSDLSFGIKWRMPTPAEGESGPSTAWLLHVDAPTGTKPFHGQGMRPSVRYVAEWDFDEWSVGMMPGIYVEHNDANKRYVGSIFAVTVGKELTDQLRTFVEFAGQQLTSPKNGGNVVVIDTGLTYLLSDRVQLDCAFSKGISHAAPRQVLEVGWSMRF
ncbi:MAG TPA: transporter [Aquabacterium sp.]|nr:transporter [Aquabacterium sp.]